MAYHSLCYILGLLLLTSVLFGQTCQNFKGSWANELGSLLVIDSVQNNGKILGRYASSTGVDGKVFELQGWVNHVDSISPTLSFTVSWNDYGSITSWTGYCLVRDGKPYIKTLWHLVRPTQTYEWERMIANTSTFTPLKN